MRWFRNTNFERGVLLTIALVIAYQVFCDPIVGTADNSDYWRVTDQIGIAYRDSAGPTRFKNVVRDWNVVEPKPVAYLTSELLFGNIAIRLNRVVSKDGLFDIRVIGLVHSVAMLGAIAMFLTAFRKRRRWLRVTIGIAALLIFTDVRLVAYFNSFYCEPAQLIFLVATIGCALHAADPTTKRRNLWFAAFLVSAVLFAFAKTQDLVFCFPLAAIGYWICPTGGRATRVALAATFVAIFVWGMKSDALCANVTETARQVEFTFEGELEKGHDVGHAEEERRYGVRGSRSCARRLG